jgi:hypothetical protein
MEKVFRRKHLCQLATIVLLPILAYSRGLTNLFTAETYDWLSWIAFPNVSTWYTEYLGYQFRPLRFLILCPIWQLFGLNPVPYRLLDLFLHIGCSVLVFFLAWIVSKRSAVGFVSGLAFSMYPRHHEVVAFVAAFYSPMTLFGLIAFCSFMLFLKCRKPTLYVLSLLSFLFALLSCEVVVTLLPLMYIAEVLTIMPAYNCGWFKYLFSYRTLKKYIPFVALVMLDAVIILSTKISTKLSSASPSYHFTGLGIRSIKDFASYVVYLVYPQIRLRTLDMNIVAIATSLIAVVILLLLLLKGSKLIRLGVLWMVVTIAPFVLLVPFGNQERYFYLPAVGYSLVLGACAVELWDRLERSGILVGRIVAVLLLVGYLVSSFFIVQRRIDERRAAGTVANEVLVQVKGLYPQVPKDSRMYFVNLPRDYNGAHIFHAGIEGAMHLLYGDQSLSALCSWDTQIVQKLAGESGQEQGGSVPGIYAFLYQDGHIRDRTASYTILRNDFDSSCWYDRFDFVCPESGK